jgi:hypothetical protein
MIGEIKLIFREVFRIVSQSFTSEKYPHSTSVASEMQRLNIVRLFRMVWSKYCRVPIVPNRSSIDDDFDEVMRNTFSRTRQRGCATVHSFHFSPASFDASLTRSWTTASWQPEQVVAYSVTGRLLVRKDQKKHGRMFA